MTATRRKPFDLERISEKAWQARLVKLLEAHGWLVYHTYDSRRSAPGFPDLVAVRGERLLAIECKRLEGEPTLEQRIWLHALGGVTRVDAFVSRPALDLTALEELLR